MYAQFNNYCKQAQLEIEFKAESQRQEAIARIGEFDSLPLEILQILITFHIVNMILKFRSKLNEFRYDSYFSARIAAALCFQFISDKKIFYK